MVCTLSVSRSTSSLGRLDRGAGIVLLCSFLALCQPAQAGQGSRLRQINSIEGNDLYRAYCAQCHGETGKGDGVRAPTLRTPAPDLTMIAVRNDGKFNRIGVQRFIEGDRPGRILKRGPTGNPVLIDDNGVADEMPVWGIVFRYMWPDQPVLIRTGSLARYLEKIQEK
jgi:mono/diheme cytochrome c family protein